MNRALLTSLVLCTATATAASAAPTTYDGITFPDGDVSFADAVVSLDQTFGGNLALNPAFSDSSQALGAPDSNGADDKFVSIGHRGRLVLQFTDNALIASGDASNDLHIFEVGPAVEGMDVEISTDNVTYLSVGSVAGSTAGVDIDSFVTAANLPLSTQFFYVRLTDTNPSLSSSGTAGADIDAVGAISSIPEPSSLALLALGAACVFRRSHRCRG